VSDDQLEAGLFEDEFEFVEPEQIVILMRNRGWLALKAEMVKRMERTERGLVAEIINGSGPVDQQKVDKARGAIQTMKWIMGLPERQKARS
jgi:hypothetical protein